MDQMRDWTLRSRRVVLPTSPTEPSQHVEQAASIQITDGLIAGIGPFEKNWGSEKIEDVGDLVVLPGLIDPHVHVNEPGTDWEGFETATRAAAAGGITLIVDMPLNSIPVTTTLAALQQKHAAAAGKLTIDAAFHAGLVPGNVDQLPALIDAGVVGVKAFLCHSGLDEFPNARPEDLRDAMVLLAKIKPRSVPLLAHAELVFPVEPMRDPKNYLDYIATRSRKFERDAIELLINLCRETGAATHIVHLADGECLPQLSAARREGLPLTVETCPHYLFFDPQKIPHGSTLHKCAPPIRGDADALWRGLCDGTIDMIASDHSPCPPEMKETGGRLDTAWGGISSLQLGLSIIRTAGQARGVGPAHIAQWMSAAPAKLLGMDHERGSIAVGKRADFAVVDWDQPWIVDPKKLQHRHAITPYADCEFHGVVKRTCLAGAWVYDDGRFTPTRQGRIVKKHG